MAYLGRSLDKISNIEILDNITFDGSSSYSITKGSVAFVVNSAQSCLISIDGIVNATNFTVNGSTIDFGVAIPSTSVCNFFLHYGTGVMTVPSDGSVTNAKLGSGSFSNITGVGTLSSGLTLSDNILFDTANKGIHLGVTTATASNLLDDYEYGNWTPGFQGASTAGTYTFLEQQGHYVKVGKQVTAWFNLTNIATTSAGSGALYLTGLPFTIDWQSGFNGSAIGSAELNYFSGISGDTIVILGSDNTDYLLFYHSTGTNNLSSNIPITDKNSDSADVRGFVTYYTGG